MLFTLLAAFLVLANGYADSCVDTDNGATDKNGKGCSYYNSNSDLWDKCSGTGVKEDKVDYEYYKDYDYKDYNDDDFTALTMCCGCNGGYTANCEDVTTKAACEGQAHCY